MNMQDNEMDNLFRSKLEGLEMEPSAHVWDSISREMGAPQQRRSIIPMLRIAASVAVLIGAGLYFMPKQQSVQGTKGPKVAVVPIVKHEDVIKPDATPAAQVDPSVNVKPAVVKPQPVQQIANVGKHTSKVQPVNVSTPDVVTKPTDPVKTQAPDPQQQALIANNTQVEKVKAVPNPAIPDVKIVDNTTVPTVKPDVIAAVPTTKEGEEQPVAKKRKVTGLGGFLNKVIAAVDKRDDKIIEFTDTDEGDAITGINLGIIKVKKQK
ncbi:hypothetical protein HQ865_13900 [Mucilaginibacter mali]|uniref:Uncharacterized protein n=1 Tax=Mucilaginibacter mali TaxID=2740462 RepID=A0A7D4UFT5_9SPHI|nr:hypothetical protein [Mucilaginibacter mali]QKJ30796.1 hypothetical protein HQ865_13900 [Mucilaginibacter mali]